ncbi:MULTISPECIES: DUF6356 family protein [Nitratireductor]|uniref:DUF6356 family protein n=1 Tax=Nitratireductor TaxID=245876 RepID=UPI001EE93741|nr:MULTISPECIES: DUF6356 family protein [Nitratireductor]
MQTRLAKLFTDHPASVDETYFGHMAFALWFGGRLALAALAALGHAFLPFAFQTTASRIVRDLFEHTHRRGANGPEVGRSRACQEDRAIASGS